MTPIARRRFIELSLGSSIALITDSVAAEAADQFIITVTRLIAKPVPGQPNLVVGTITLSGAAIGNTIPVNGTVIGNTYENDDLKINPGSYPGRLRYWADHNFVQGPFGILGQIGDFLIQLDNVTTDEGIVRTGVLLHYGNQPKHSTGCILLGPVHKDPSTGIPYLADEDPLRKLRLAFYGSDTPSSTPDKKITINVVVGTPSIAGAWAGPGTTTDGRQFRFSLFITSSGTGAMKQVMSGGGAVTQQPIQGATVTQRGEVSFATPGPLPITFSGTLGNDLASINGKLNFDGHAESGPISIKLKN